MFAPEGFLPFPRGNRLTRRKNLARDRVVGNVATTSRTVSCRMTLGNMSVAMESTTVKQRALEYMPRTRSGLGCDGEVPEIVDLCADDDGPEPGRRYGGLFSWFLALILHFSVQVHRPLQL